MSDTATRTNGRQRGPTGLTGNRGRPTTVTMRRTTALAPCLEGVALCDETMTSAERIQTAAAVGSRQLVVQEAGRMGVRAAAYRERFREMAKATDR